MERHAFATHRAPEPGDGCLPDARRPSGYAAFYSDEATIIGFDKRKIQGRAAVDAFCLEMTGITEAKAVVLDVGMSGDLIYQVATSFASWVRDGVEGSYLCDCMYVWRKEADGTYRIFLDAYN